jgi:hypothetical protein
VCSNEFIVLSHASIGLEIMGYNREDFGRRER